MRYAPVSYWYPTAPAWDTVLNAKTKPPFALINPNSGPGTALDQNYKTLTMELLRRGIRPVGYVSTLWGKRASSEILAEIATYVNRYGARGVFFDECPNFWSPDQDKHISKYRELQTKIRSTYGSDFFIVHNPGTVPIRAMIDLADLHMSFESSATNYLTNDDYFPAWLSEIDGSKFWHVVYGIDSQGTAEMVIAYAKSRRVGTVTFTDRKHDPKDVDGNNAPSSDANNPYLTAPAPWLIKLMEGENVASQLVPGPIIGYLGKKTNIHQMNVEASGFKTRTTIKTFDIPAGKQLLIVAFGSHGGNPWQSPSLGLAEAGSSIIRPGFPNFDTGSVKAGAEWRWGTTIDGGTDGRRLDLTVGNESPYDDAANRVVFKGTVVWAVLDVKDFVNEPVFNNLPGVETRPVSVTGALGLNTVHSLTSVNVPAGQTWSVRLQGNITKGGSTAGRPRFNIGGANSEFLGVGPVDFTGTITSANSTIAMITSSAASNVAVDFSGTVTITKP